ncbi:MAG: hypothetical protein NDI69_10815 [Bacteriovoracaceae bacterium]|nr:hypothetical protein [Bacteriovoracaceae bacterium]
MKSFLFVAFIFSTVAFAETTELQSVESVEAVDAVIARCEATAIDGAYGVADHAFENVAANFAINNCRFYSRMPHTCSVVRCFPIQVW